MGLTAASRQLQLPKRAPFEESITKPSRISQTSRVDFSKRPISALARHQPHKLSEIREVSDSSKTSLPRRCAATYIDAPDGTVKTQEDDTKDDCRNLEDNSTSLDAVKIVGIHVAQHISSRSDLGSLAPSALSLPLHEIPKRKSSMSALSQSYPGSHRASIQDLRSESLDVHKTILPGEHTNSPVRQSLERGTQTSEALRASPSQTFVRTINPFYLLDKDNPRNPRLDMSVRLPSPLFVGGGTVEGQIELKIDATSSKKLRSKPLLISRLSVDVIGVEEVEDGRRRIFLSLATELFDSQHPPPSTLVSSQTPEKGSELYWQTRPGTATIPFCVNLPLKLGPPPYSSRQASIRYILCPSAVIKIGEKRSAIRQAWNIQMLTIHDPEKALASLPSPLLATDSLTLSYTPILQSVTFTAGLHRQTWVSGGVIFTDVHIVNGTDKILKRIELQLEKSVLWFLHSAAGTAQKRATNLRLPTKIVTETVCKSVIRRSKTWHGVAPQASEARTCELEIPKGHVTIGDGRYFEVRYYVKLTISVTRNKSVSVQLPVTIVHINSLDIMPNSLAQVAASIEAKRSMTSSAMGNRISRQPHSQGQAFIAARQQPANHTKHPAESVNSNDIRALMHDVDSSPRRLRNVGDAEPSHTSTGEPSATQGKGRPSLTSCPRHRTPRLSCYHCHLLSAEHDAKTSQNVGPKLPRLQVSTSGLGFSETEFEIPPESPRKVMLSEKERQTIQQQRELRLQRQWNQQNDHGAILEKQNSITRSGLVGWKNVAAVLEAGSGRETSVGLYPPLQQLSQRECTKIRAQRSSLPPLMSGRSRSKTNPDHLRTNFSEDGPTELRTGRPSRGLKSIDRGDRYPWSGYSLVDNDVFGPRRTLSDDFGRSGVRQPMPAQRI